MSNNKEQFQKKHFLTQPYGLNPTADALPHNMLKPAAIVKYIE
jgi:hypothetical protein